jgi:uncharacterized linocin/CFP29 family protein
MNMTNWEDSITQRHNSTGVEAVPQLSSVHKDAYKQFMKLYDIAEGYIDDLENMGDEAAVHIEAVDELVEAIEEQSETVMAYYVKYVQSGKKLSGVEKQKIESALTKIKEAIAKFKAAEEKVGVEFNYEI